MSTPYPTDRSHPAAKLTAPVPRQWRAPRWAREPLLHFVAVGALLFAADHFLREPADDPHTIVVGPDVDRQAVEIFEQSRGRKPEKRELAALHRIWIDNEVLYREGLAMQVDKGDDAIRERVIFKALSVIDANVKLPAVDDHELRRWFEQHRDKYDEPARFDFQEAVLSGDSSEAAVRAFVDELNNGTPGDARAGLRVFHGRPHANLVQSYGADFARSLEESTVGQWHALRAKDAWRAVILQSVSAPKPADFDVLRNVVLQDWKDSVAAEQRSAAVGVLARKYTIRFEPAP